MTGRGRRGGPGRRTPRHWAVSAWLVIGSIAFGSIAGAFTPQPARAQEQIEPADGQWVDPAASTQWTEINDAVDQTIEDVWSDDTDAGESWVEPAPVETAAPSYDTNGNLIDPNTGIALAIGPDGAPIDAAAGLYYDEVGNLIDPATGLTVSWDENGQRVLQEAAPAGTAESADGSAVPEEDVPELVTTPWLAPPPSGPPPGFQNWNPPTTVYIPETGQSVDGVFLDAWRDWGGAESWGFPLTQEFQEDGRIVQYYDYGRFEYHPEDPNGLVVHFGDLGRQMRPFMVRRASGSGSALERSRRSA